ncbi:MAG: DUF1761 domain-containing protein [Pseudomonadota bacterium]
MEYLAVLSAAMASYIFGAVWYGVFSKPWMQAAGLTEEDIKAPGGPQSGAAMPYIITFLMTVIVAGMMRHVFVTGGVVGLVNGIVSGFGVGAFLASPWIMTNYTFSMRPRMLAVIDCGYATIGCTIMGVVLVLFGVAG